MTSQFSPERIADRLEIQDVLSRYSRAIDRLDFDLLHEVYHEDAIDNHVKELSLDDFISWVRERHKNISISWHSFSNVLIDFVGDDHAVVESYALVYQCYPPEARQALVQLAGNIEGSPDRGRILIIPGRSLDRFERRDGRWKIARRTIVHETSLIFDMPPEPAAGPNWVRARRDREDFSFKERKAFGDHGQYLRS